MKKEQFLQELRESLEGEVSDQALYENINYYRQYLEDQQREGKTEEEAIEELGQPSWIARSIIEAEEVSTGNGSVYEDDVYTQGDDEEEGRLEVHEIKWYHKLLFIIILVLVILAIVSIAGAVLSFLWPIILILLLISVIARFIL